MASPEERRSTVCVFRHRRQTLLCRGSRIFGDSRQQSEQSAVRWERFVSRTTPSSMKKLTRKLKRRLLYRARRQLHKVRRKHSGRARREESRTAIGSGKSRPHRVTAWSGGVPETVICETAPVSPPARLCLVEAWSETLDFLAQIQRFSRSAGVKESANSGKSWFLKKRSPRGLRRIPTYLDFAQIQHLSTAAALVITAEYDAACLYWNDPPPTIDLE